MLSEIEEYREKIDKIDYDLLCLLNRRAKLVTELGIIKKRLSVPVRDPQREKNVLTRLLKENCGPLDERGVLKIFQLIICESRRIEATAFEIK